MVQLVRGPGRAGSLGVGADPQCQPVAGPIERTIAQLTKAAAPRRHLMSPPGSPSCAGDWCPRKAAKAPRVRGGRPVVSAPGTR